MAKTEQSVAQQAGKRQRRSPIGTNDYFRQMRQQAVGQPRPFGSALTAVWSAAAENRRLLQQALHPDVVRSVHTNRQVGACAGTR